MVSKIIALLILLGIVAFWILVLTLLVYLILVLRKKYKAKP